MRRGNRCVDGEKKRESERASGGQLDDTRSVELEESAWPVRNELETESVAAERDRGTDCDTKLSTQP